jgi:hypothetical protein
MQESGFGGIFVSKIVTKPCLEKRKKEKIQGAG